MTTEKPDHPASKSAQGTFQEFGTSEAVDDGDPGELSEFSMRMLNRLGSTIENELIPRLMLAFDSRQTDLDPVRVTKPLSEHVPEFVQLLIEQDAHIAARYVDVLRSEGYPLATLYLDLLGPAARRLGEMWEEDTCSFADVTIGVCRMHQVLLEFTRCFDASAGNGKDSRNALVAPAPGEQHTFGLFMVMEFLRRDGWNCYSGTPATRKDFLALARAHEFELIGLSIGADRHVDEARRLIADLRRHTNAKIVVGGGSFLDNPELAKELGADGMASDGREAVRVIDSLVGRAAQGDN